MEKWVFYVEHSNNYMQFKEAFLKDHTKNQAKLFSVDTSWPQLFKCPSMFY